MHSQKKTAAVNTPTATISASFSQAKMLYPQLLMLFILLPANLANNSSHVSFPHKCFLVLDCSACWHLISNCHFTFINI